jgi:lipopolysaccharide/colanic/teichoic acid biosynthesis glycosyltransferase
MPPTRPDTPTSARTGDTVKAIVDRLFAGFLLVVLAPVIGLALAITKWTSRGPALYMQSRVGQGGRVFTIYKIRTMYHDCESLTGPRWSMPGDPRITPIGHIFRTLHIDELPQLWNVVNGDMSLVGPRPERPEICAEIRREIYGYDRRQAVKPGITGWAQIHLPPDSNMNSVRNKLVYDRFYIANRSPWLELQILACTALKLIGLRKCYQITRPWLRETE